MAELLASLGPEQAMLALAARSDLGELERKAARQLVVAAALEQATRR